MTSLQSRIGNAPDSFAERHDLILIADKKFDLFNKASADIYN
jgi:hypothetical protein